MLRAERSGRADRDEREREPDREAEYERNAEQKPPRLQAEQQHGDGRAARHEPAREPEHHDLPRRHVPVREAAADVVRVRERVRVERPVGRQLEALRAL